MSTPIIEYPFPALDDIFLDPHLSEADRKRLILHPINRYQRFLSSFQEILYIYHPSNPKIVLKNGLFLFGSFIMLFLGILTYILSKTQPDSSWYIMISIIFGFGLFIYCVYSIIEIWSVFFEQRTLEILCTDKIMLISLNSHHVRSYRYDQIREIKQIYNYKNPNRIKKIMLCFTKALVTSRDDEGETHRRFDLNLYDLAVNSPFFQLWNKNNCPIHNI